MEQFEIVLEDPNVNGVRVTRSTGIITIEDNDVQGPVANVSFDIVGLSANEEEEVMTVEVLLNGAIPAGESVSVDFATIQQEVLQAWIS